MSELIREQIDATGVAQVIVVLKDARSGGAPGTDASLILTSSGDSRRKIAKRLEKHFDQSSTSIDGAIAAAAKGARERKETATNLATKASLSLVTGIAGGTTTPEPRYYEHLGVILGSVDAAGLKALNNDSNVASIELAPEFSLIRPVATAKTAIAAGPTWGLAALKVPELRDKGLTGKGVLVGHLDTGVDAAHPALRTAVAHFAEFDLLGQPVPGAIARDSDVHGTHTAGTIAGRKFRKAEFGVAPSATLACALVIEGGNIVARVLAGLNWAVGLNVRVISMSLGLRGFNKSFLTVTQIIRARNILPVFAVGNEGPGTNRSPGNYDEALSVGAIDESKIIADFSSSGRFLDPTERFVPDLVAPGVDVLSCTPGRSTALFSGTSMATPHIAGLAALLFEAFPAATAEQVEAAIFDSSKRPMGMAAARGGRGIPNGMKSLKALGDAL